MQNDTQKQCGINNNRAMGICNQLGIYATITLSYHPNKNTTSKGAMSAYCIECAIMSAHTQTITSGTRMKHTHRRHNMTGNNPPTKDRMKLGWDMHLRHHIANVCPSTKRNDGTGITKAWPFIILALLCRHPCFCFVARGGCDPMLSS